ncbi:MAG: glycosyltransferase [Gammaproteobacteria bacterium]|nr:glycosyltransferase [Gammaproteobacteria bacterium]
MKILLLSPQPFYQVRGTPIAIDLLVQTLSKQGHCIDLVTYHEGEARQYDNVNHIRTKRFRFLNKIGPGFSIKKLVCSGLMFFTAWSLLRKRKYDLVHANEEAVFMAWFYKKLYRTPYVYDMDSSLSGQMTDKFQSMRGIFKLAEKLEKVAIRNSIGVLAVCEALCQIARAHNNNVFLLTDVSMLDRLQPSPKIDTVISKDDKLVNFMYIGNLETYQGVDLMLESFALARKSNPLIRLIVIGGSLQSIKYYRDYATKLRIGQLVNFVGPKPFDDIGKYMEQADVLLSPRIHGENTPMKIYNYMASGKAIIATKTFSHTQVLDECTAELAEVCAESLSKAMVSLANDSQKRIDLGKTGRSKAESEYSVAAFEDKVAKFFGELIQSDLGGGVNG